jgi:hypothetical protein
MTGAEPIAGEVDVFASEAIADDSHNRIDESSEWLLDEDRFSEVSSRILHLDENSDKCLVARKAKPMLRNAATASENVGLPTTLMLREAPAGALAGLLSPRASMGIITAATIDTVQGQPR